MAIEMQDGSVGFSSAHFWDAKPAINRYIGGPRVVDWLLEKQNRLIIASIATLFALSPYTLETQPAEKITRPRAPAESLFPHLLRAHVHATLIDLPGRRISFPLSRKVFV